MGWDACKGICDARDRLDPSVEVGQFTGRRRSFAAAWRKQLNAAAHPVPEGRITERRTQSLQSLPSFTNQLQCGFIAQGVAVMPQFGGASEARESGISRRTASAERVSVHHHNSPIGMQGARVERGGKADNSGAHHHQIDVFEPRV